MLLYLVIICSLFIPFLYSFVLKTLKKTIRLCIYIIKRIYQYIIINHKPVNNSLDININNQYNNNINNDFQSINFNDDNENIIDYRFTIYQYLSELRDGRRSKIEQYIWKKLEYILPENLKYIDNECGINHPLPYWIEELLKIYNKPYVCKFLVSFLIFIILIFSSNLWIGFIIDLPYNNQLLLNDHYKTINGLNFPNCFNIIDHYYNDNDNDHNSNITGNNHHYCLIQKNNIWSKNIDFIPSSFIKSPISTSLSKKKIFKKINISENNYYYHIRNIFYYKFYDLIDEKDKLINKNELIQKLEEIRNDDPIPCICPSYIGIIGNYSFIYNDIDQEWIILYKPFLSRNNTFSDLKKSNIRYDKGTNQFIRHEYIKNLINYTIQDEYYLHYESFIITSIVNNNNNDNIQSIEEKEENEKEIIIENEENLILKKNKIDLNKIMKMTLKESDSICFVHCENINKKIIY